MRVLISILLLCYSIAIVSCSLFSSTDIFISSNPMMIYSNGTAVDFENVYLKPREFKSGIVPFDNLTQPPSSGLEGILYDRGYSCQPDASFGFKRPDLLNMSSKIALVKKGGGCSFYQKVYLSELDGASGVIIFDDIAFRDDDNSGSMKITKGNITISMYYVDLNIGQELTNMLQYVAAYPISNTSDNATTFQPVISLTMHPAVGGFPSAWEFTLIIVVALLAISFLASVGMHWHLWRIRRRQRAIFENGLLDINAATVMPQPQKKTIEPASLALFQTRIIGDEPLPPSIDEVTSITLPSLTRVESARSERSSKAIENAELLLSATIPVATPHSSLPEQPSAASDACVICLDEFALGEQVRKLPCGHEYHCECIDPWLTIKSASCPLCKYDCSLNIPKSQEQEETLAGETSTPPPPSYRSNPFFSTISSFRSRQNGSPFSMSSSSAFGPTIHADQAEEFSRSWMARSLPRNMRRQIEAVAAANRESVIELPARMTQQPSVHTPLTDEWQDNTISRRLGRKLIRTLPRLGNLDHRSHGSRDPV